MAKSNKKPPQKIIHSEIYTTIMAAPTRSGKGVSSLIPTLLAYPGSEIVLDFKGENFDYNAGFRPQDLSPEVTNGKA